MRFEIDEVSFVDIFNAVLGYKKQIISPAELVSTQTIPCGSEISRIEFFFTLTDCEDEDDR